MADITIWGGRYSDAKGVDLPKTGGGTARFMDTSPTTAVASDVASGKIFFLADGTQSTGTSSGGGASNLVQGTFTSSATRASTMTVAVPYTGSGYPIAAMVFIAGGVYNNTADGNTDWYNAISRYDVGLWYMTKARQTTAPTYTTGTADNYGCTAYIYKSSTTSATTYARSSAMNTNTYTSSSTNAGSANNCVRFKGNGKTLTVYIGNNTSSTYGFPPSTELQYIIVYSS